MAQFDLGSKEVWFLTGSQHLYGDEVLKQVAGNSQQIASALDGSDSIPVRVVFKPVLTTQSEITRALREASMDDRCVGLVMWMHTFSPAKMWIDGLKSLTKPFLHLHTQFNRDLPWAEIDMDFMNLNQSAHGDREFGFICSRLGLSRKVVVGHWSETSVLSQIGGWSRAACAWSYWQGARIARFGDNMRQVAVTEGNKVSAQEQFGFAVDGFGVGDLVARMDAVAESDIDALINEYVDSYDVVPSLLPGGDRHDALRYGAKTELGLRAFLEDGGYCGFTTTFEDLHGLDQLPGLAVQRLMNDGYGFGAEGDWKTAALLRATKVMSSGLQGGTSFMEDYTYHLHPDGQKVLGAHMLEICESIADGKPSLDIHPLSIGGKADPVRLVFDSMTGSAVNVTLIDLGHRFRMIVNEVDVVKPDEPMPNLPVARAMWVPEPDLKTAAAAWILAGGAHHTAFSLALKKEVMQDFAEMAGIECLVIDEGTTIDGFKNELRWNEVAY